MSQGGDALCRECLCRTCMQLCRCVRPWRGERGCQVAACNSYHRPAREKPAARRAAPAAPGWEQTAMAGAPAAKQETMTGAAKYSGRVITAAEAFAWLDDIAARAHRELQMQNGAPAGPAKAQCVQALDEALAEMAGR